MVVSVEYMRRLYTVCPVAGSAWPRVLVSGLQSLAFSSINTRLRPAYVTHTRVSERGAWNLSNASLSHLFKNPEKTRGEIVRERTRVLSPCLDCHRQSNCDTSATI